MKITSIVLKNFKQFKDLKILRPNGGDIFLLGNNDVGKTSIVQAIFGGLKQISLPTSTIKEGETSGEIHIKIGDDVREYDVLLKLSKDKKDELTLRTKEGAKIDVEPVTKLKDLVGNLIYNVFELANMKPKDQIEWIQDKFNINITDLSTEYDKVYTSRRDNKRDLKKMETEVSASGLNESDFDLEEVDISELTTELSEANKHNQKVALKNQALTVYAKQITEDEEEIKRIQQRIDASKKEIEATEKFISKNPVIDTSFIEEQIQLAGNQNAIVEKSKGVAQKKAYLKKLQETVSTQSEKLSQLKSEEQNRISTSKLPKGFELHIPTEEDNREGLYFEGLPYSELNQSTSTIMKSSMTIQDAINPNGLKIAVLHRYESIGTQKRKDIEDFMKEHNLQGVFELVDVSKQELVISESI